MRGRLLPACLLVLTVVLPIRPAHANDHAHGEGELVLFASAEGRTSDSDQEIYRDDEGVLTADVLGSWSKGRFRVFGELLLSTDEQELERLQLGWQLAPETFVWVGRFHQPSSVWNSFHHHGQYLQPSISRPVIEDWEDEGGILPQHVEGLFFERRHPLGSEARHGVVVAASAGIGPVLGPEGLEPYEVFSSRSYDRRPAVAMRLMYLPSFADDDGIGILASHTEIGLQDTPEQAGGDHVDLDVYGAYLTWTAGPWQTQAALYRIRAGFYPPSGGGEAFWAGYAQLRRELGAGLSLLARYEDSDGAGDSRYVALFPDFVEQRTVVDLRWDFATRHALSLEAATNHAREGQFNELRLQWSAAFR